MNLLKLTVKKKLISGFAVVLMLFVIMTVTNMIVQPWFQTQTRLLTNCKTQGLQQKI